MRLTVQTDEARETAKRVIHRRISADWRRHRTLQRYYEQALPRQWHGGNGDIGMKDCDKRFLERQQTYPRDRYAVQSLPCLHLPYCFRCAERETHRRVYKTIDAFHACKPAAKPPLFIHIVQTAPLTENGEGWGANARENLDQFFQVVWNSLVEFYGEGIGGKLTYQDFGSYGPQKPHPHIDLTLNGWRIQDGKVLRLKRPDLRRGDLQKWQRIILDHSRILGSEKSPGSIFIGDQFDHAAPYFDIMAYQLRELWDFTAISNPAPHTLRWHSYKGGWHDYTENQFYAHMLDYQKRYGQWGDWQRATLDRAFGHMAKGQVRKTMNAMGGKPRKHPRGCPCTQCGDWYPISQNVRRPADMSRDSQDLRTVELNISPQ